jgi:peptidoglycan hydrolase CwlO-like protein
MKIDDTEKQIKIDDDFFKMPEEQWKPQENNMEDGAVAKTKHLLPVLLPIAFILIIIIGAATVFLRMQISTVKGDIINLYKKVGNIDISSFKSEMSAIEAKLDHIKNENDKLKSDLAQLRNEIEAIKARKEKADAAIQKQPVAKKKAVNKNPRVR